MSKTPYDPYTMRIKEIPELIAELSKLLMSRLPGTPATQALWGVFCEACRLHREAAPDPEEKFEGLTYRLGQETGQSYAAHVMIRKIADGLGVDNFKLREVPLEPTVPGPEQGGRPGPGQEDQPG